MKRLSIAVLIGGVCLAAALTGAEAAPCLVVTLTGTQGGPPAFKGLAGPGTLVRYGEDSNNCSAVKLQFDAGRGTSMRLSQLDISPDQLNAVFFTHMHNDHTEGFADLVQLRWMFWGAGPKIDVICSADAVSALGFTMSCRKFTTHIGDSFIQSGEVAQRHSEVKDRTAGGPADLINTITFEPRDESRVGLVRGRRQGERGALDAYRGPCVLSRGYARRQRGDRRRCRKRCASRHRGLPRRPTRWRSWPRAPTSSCIRQFIPSWVRTRGADFFRMPIFAKATLSISARWRSAQASSISS